MASFSGDIGIPAGGFNLLLEYSISQNIAGNYSVVSATGYVKRNRSSYYPYNTTSNASINIGGNVGESHPSYNLGSDGYKVIMSHSATIPHNTDGTKSITISFSFNGLLSNYYPNGSISQTITLPRIPRASSITCSNETIGDSATINITRASSSFTDTITYTFGTLTDTIATKTSSTTLSWDTSAIKNDLYAQMTDAKEKKGTITCQTYDGNTLIGSSSAQFTLYANESECTPNLTYTIVETNPVVIEELGTDTILIKGLSKPKITLTGTPKFSSTISSYKINLNGNIVNTNEHTYNSLTGNLLIVSCTDSRGYTKTLEETLTVVDYNKIIASASVSRAEKEDDNAYATITGTWYNGNFGNIPNSIAISWEYRESDSQIWLPGGNITPTISENTFEIEDYLLGDFFDYSKEYKVKFTIYDLFSTNEIIKTRQKNDYTLKDTYYESDILTYEDVNGIEDYIYETYNLLNRKMGTSYGYVKQLWYKNSAVLVSKLNHIEQGIKMLGIYYYRPEGWQNTKVWSTTQPQKFDYTDVNRWINDLNILTKRLYEESNLLFPRDDLYPSDTLLPR